MILHVLPNVGDWLPNQIGNHIIGSEKLNFLPDPERSFHGTMAFNQNYGIGHEPSMLKRALVALPFLPMAYLFRTIFTTIIAQPAFTTQLMKSLGTNQIDFGCGQSWDIPRLPEPLPLLVAVFSPSLLNIDPAQRLQALSFLIDLAPLYLLWILESHRRANIMKLISFPVLFGIAFQIFGIGVIGPLFFFLHYVRSPLADYTALDWRLVNVAAARTAPIAIIFAFTIPTFAMYLLPDLTMRLSVNAAWQTFPILVSITHYILNKTLVKDTTQDDRLHKVHADLPHIRFAVKALAVTSAVTFNWVRFISSASISEIFLPSWSTLMSLLSFKPMDLDLVSGMTLFLQLDEISCFTAAFLWLALLTKDLKEAEMTDISWRNMALCAGLGTYVAGPGAVAASAWLWREEILANKRAKGAVVRPGNLDRMAKSLI
jgi:hypothetical protein